MTEFKITENKLSNRKRERELRLMAWGTVLVMAAITFFAAFGARSAGPQVIRAVGWLAIVIVVAAILGANFLAARLGIEKFEHDLTFILTDNIIVRKRRGWPDVQIELSEIKALSQRPGWLVVESKEPNRRMAIPDRIEGFELLRTELAKHGRIVVTPAAFQRGYIVMVASILCWGLVLLSTDRDVVIGAGAAALGLLAWESGRLLRQLRHKRKTGILAILIGLGWIAACLLVYFRLKTIL